MNRNRAGLLAIGVLIVAIAIVLVGGIFMREDTPASQEIAATSKAPVAKEVQTRPKEVAPAAPDTNPAGPQAGDKAANTASGSGPASEKPAASFDKSATPARPGPSDETETAKQAPTVPPASDTLPPTAAERTAKPFVPAFDILRVEPDGSTVIAGRAAPGAKVEIMNGDKVMTSTVAGEQGDFVAVFDEPLAPGDYELKLKAVGKDGNAVGSEEVATVSVPKDKNGELLAMVTKHGEASRIITAPRPARTGASADTTKGGGATGPASASGENAVADASPETDGQAVTNEADRGSRPTDPSQVRVDAVEIEGQSLYVAGAAPAGSTVRVYADDKLVGEAEASEEGRFVVDAKMPLTVGDHSIRADLVDSTTGQVIVRAAVPFTRPEGDQFAAVAPGAKVSGAKTNTAAPDTSPGDGALSPDVARLRTEAEAALSDLKAKIEAATPSADEIAKARDRAEKGLAALANAPRTAAGKADTSVRRKAGSALAMLDALPRLAKGAHPDLAIMKAMRGKLPDIEKSLRGENEEPASAVAEAAAGPNGPKTVLQPALTSSDDFVIIRRGDTLWQIARRAYGRGVRYTTIYLANSDQISDPDLILPGQIFDVPQKPLMNSEELHRERLQAERHG